MMPGFRGTACAAFCSGGGPSLAYGVGVGFSLGECGAQESERRSRSDHR